MWAFWTEKEAGGVQDDPLTAEAPILILIKQKEEVFEVFKVKMKKKTYAKILKLAIFDLQKHVIPQKKRQKIVI